ncbi:MAG: DNA-binding response regulator [Flavobacteriia bacterium]|jgi:DNA-binding response OmpR family regulator|nr:DNA-binding response regulator [Flavobacteriia bacterium]
MKILVAEDDENLGLLLSAFLEEKGYEPSIARSGIKVLELYRENPSRYQFIILDVMMPGMDGFSVAKEIRLIDKKTPILFLSAKTLELDRLKGFEVGADDYLTKPFAMEELLARIKAILRRVEPQDSSEWVKIGHLNFMPSQNLIQFEEGSQRLTTKENALLELLAHNINEVVDRQAALRAIWGDDSYFNGRSMDVYIAKLRKILSHDPSVEILNVHGIGFKLIVK